MQEPEWTNIAAAAIVSLAAGWLVKQVFGPRAGVATALAAAAAHNKFDAPLAGYLARTFR